MCSGKRSIVIGVCFMSALLTEAPRATAQNDSPGNVATLARKGDVLVWPHVRIRWNGTTTQADTFITVTNDDTAGHKFIFYFVDSRTNLTIDASADLTGNQSRYFSALSGTGGSTALPSFKSLSSTGYPSNPCDPADPNRVLEGFIVGWTVDANFRPIGTNHMTGSATLIDYTRESVWDYKPTVFRSNFSGAKPDPTRLRFDDNFAEYRACPSKWLVDFWAVGATTDFTAQPSALLKRRCTLQDIELSIANMALDFRALPDYDLDGTTGELPTMVPRGTPGSSQDSEPPTTAVQITAWNEAGIPFSEIIRCVTCWDSGLGSEYGATIVGPGCVGTTLQPAIHGGSPFARTALQTDKGMALLSATSHTLCDRPASAAFSNPIIYSKASKSLPIVITGRSILMWDQANRPATYEDSELAISPIGRRNDGFVAFDPLTTPMAQVPYVSVGTAREDQRAVYEQRGDLLVWPDVTIRWDDRGTLDKSDDQLLQDALISVCNTDAAAQSIRITLVEGASWRRMNQVVTLAANQSTYFSAFHGRSMPALGLSVGAFRKLNKYGMRDADGGPTGRKISGFIVGWAVDGYGQPVGIGNRLSGSAMVIDHATESSWGYGAWAFRSNYTGTKIDITRLLLNGGRDDYQTCPSHLLVDFISTGSRAFGSASALGHSASATDFEMSNVIMALDFRALPDFDMDGLPGEPAVKGGMAGDTEPPTTAMQVLTWNENEISISSNVRCITCWDSVLASSSLSGVTLSPFSRSALQTDKGKGRLNATRSAACDRAASSAIAVPLVYGKTSFSLPILGICNKRITWSGTAPARTAKSAMSLVGMGERTDGFVALDAPDYGGV